MPRGARPGERRGGRAAGTPDKATVEKQEALDRALFDAFAARGAEYMESLMPAEAMLVAMREAIKAGHVRAAFTMAKEAAPYFDKRASEKEKDTSSYEKIIIEGGLTPPDAD